MTIVSMSRLEVFFRCSRADSIAFVCIRRATVGSVVPWVLFMVLRSWLLTCLGRIQGRIGIFTVRLSFLYSMIIQLHSTVNPSGSGIGTMRWEGRSRFCKTLESS